MDTSLFPFPDALSFAEIARAWSQCPGAPDAEEIQTVLVRAMWRGAFERDGEPLTFLFRRPENRKLPDGSTIRYDGEANGIVTRSVRRPPGSDHSDEESRGVMTSEREQISFSRTLILEAMHYLRPEHDGDPFAHLTFEGMAAVSLSKYDPAARAAYLDHLRLSPSDLAAWFSSAPVNWPRPVWLRSTDAVAPSSAMDSATFNHNRNEALLQGRGPGNPGGGKYDIAIRQALEEWPLGPKVNVRRTAKKVALAVGLKEPSDGVIKGIERRIRETMEEMNGSAPAHTVE